MTEVVLAADNFCCSLHIFCMLGGLWASYSRADTLITKAMPKGPTAAQKFFKTCNDALCAKKILIFHLEQFRLANFYS